MRERSLELKVGLMILISSAILAGFIFVLGNFSLRSGFTVSVDFDYIGSLQAGAPIKVSGIKVGKVEDVKFIGGKLDPKTNRRTQVRVTAWVEDRVRDSIRSDAEFFINTAGVLGEQYLEIVPGKAWDKPPLAPDTIVFEDAQVHDPPRTDLVVARLYDVLEGVSSVLRDEREGIKALIKNGAQAVTEVNTLLVQNREQLGTLISEGALLAKEAKITLGKVNNGLGDGRAITTLLATQNVAYLPNRSLSRPISGPRSIEHTPVITYRRGRRSSVMCWLFTVNALANGISMNPPVASSMVARKPTP